MFPRLSANCLQCDKGLVNPSVPLVITGLCLTCPLDDTDITYTWKIFHVVVGDSELVAKEECKPAPEGSSQDSGMLNSDVSSTSKPSPTVLPSEGTTLRRPTYRSVTPRTVKATNPPNLQIKFASGSICRDSDQILGRSTNRRHPGGGSGSGDSGSGGSHGRGKGSGSGVGGAGTGSGTGRGSGTGFDPNNFGAGAKNKSMVSTTTSQQNFTTKAAVTDDNGNETQPEDIYKNNELDDIYKNNELGDIYNPHYTPRSAKHSGSIITLRRREVDLSEKYTATGLKSQNFVLLDKYQYFIGGRTYMVAFTVSDGRTGRNGKVTVYFNTSDIPECGVCRVTPSAGVAMETTFQLTCSKWIAVVRLWQAFVKNLIFNYMYLLLTKFEVCTVSCESSSFSPLTCGPSESKRKKNNDDS